MLTNKITRPAKKTPQEENPGIKTKKEQTPSSSHPTRRPRQIEIAESQSASVTAQKSRGGSPSSHHGGLAQTAAETKAAVTGVEESHDAEKPKSEVGKSSEAEHDEEKPKSDVGKSPEAEAEEQVYGAESEVGQSRPEATATLEAPKSKAEEQPKAEEKFDVVAAKFVLEDYDLLKEALPTVACKEKDGPSGRTPAQQRWFNMMSMLQVSFTQEAEDTNARVTICSSVKLADGYESKPSVDVVGFDVDRWRKLMSDLDALRVHMSPKVKLELKAYLIAVSKMRKEFLNRMVIGLVLEYWARLLTRWTFRNSGSIDVGVDATPSNVAPAEASDSVLEVHPRCVHNANESGLLSLFVDLTDNAEEAADLEDCRDRFNDGTNLMSDFNINLQVFR